MERGSITKWLFLGLAVFLFFTYGKRFFVSPKASELQPLGRADTVQPAEGSPEICTLDGARFKAELSTRGASLQHLYLQDRQYTKPTPMPDDLAASVKHLVVGNHDASSEPADLVTTTREARMPLRTDLRAPAAGDEQQQVGFDDVDWKLADHDAQHCTFTYEDKGRAKLTKRIALTGDPFQLEVETTVKNTSAEPKKHRFTIEQTDWRTKKEMEGHLGRQSERQTDALAVTATKVDRVGPGDFEPGEFAKPETFTPDRWRKAEKAPTKGQVAAVDSVYFTKLVIPQTDPDQARAETQIEEIWDPLRHPVKDEDPQHSYVYRARIAYPETELKPGESATYKVLSYAGPKERELLKEVGQKAGIDDKATDVLDLGKFAIIARGLVRYLYALHDFVKSWGWAIVLLTITVRIALFPLSLSQIKNSAAMRRLKPEMDVINEKHKDDAAQKGLAIQELWRKEGITNPVLGCLPMLLQMPIWWALYTALQTAVELYHIPFGPVGGVIPDLSAPGKFLIIPLVLGASSFFQQRLMPTQGDAQQQKMMMYMMPAVFTFMMLFLPAGLGVYMLTNSMLAIGQQLLVERYLRSRSGPKGQIEVREKSSGGGEKPAPALGKGKARARG